MPAPALERSDEMRLDRLALGRIGGPKAAAGLKAMPADSMAPALALTLRAAQCMAGEPCEASISTIVEAVTAPSASAAVVRSGVSALTSIASIGNQSAISALVTLGERGGVVHDQAALGLGTVAVIDPDIMIAWLDRAPQKSRESAVALLKDGFDDLEAD